MNNKNVSIDEWLLEKFNGLKRRPESVLRPKKKIAVISTPRCGSTYFCQSVASTGRFGDPAEWMNVQEINAYANVNDVNTVIMGDYIKFLVEKTTTDNGVFSINFHVDQYMLWKKKGFDILSIEFDHVIRLYRKDRLGQALSYAKALKTKQWRSYYKQSGSVTLDDITTSMVMKELYMISVWDEYYNLHLAPHVHKSYSYEEFSTGDSIFHDVLEQCGIHHADIQRFSTDMEIQRGTKDKEKLRDILAYLGTQPQ